MSHFMFGCLLTGFHLFLFFVLKTTESKIGQNIWSEQSSKSTSVLGILIEIKPDAYPKPWGNASEGLAQRGAPVHGVPGENTNELVTTGLDKLPHLYRLLGGSWLSVHELQPEPWGKKPWRGPTCLGHWQLFFKLSCKRAPPAFPSQFFLETNLSLSKLKPMDFVSLTGGGEKIPPLHCRNNCHIWRLQPQENKEDRSRRTPVQPIFPLRSDFFFRLLLVLPLSTLTWGFNGTHQTGISHTFPVRPQHLPVHIWVLSLAHVVSENNFLHLIQRVISQIYVPKYTTHFHLGTTKQAQSSFHQWPLRGRVPPALCWGEHDSLSLSMADVFLFTRKSQELESDKVF